MVSPRYYQPRDFSKPFTTNLAGRHLASWMGIQEAADLSKLASFKLVTLASAGSFSSTAGAWGDKLPYEAHGFSRAMILTSLSSRSSYLVAPGSTHTIQADPSAGNDRRHPRGDCWTAVIQSREYLLTETESR
jgi:hypothetical protein